MREIYRRLVAAKRREIAAHEARVFQVWLGESLHRAKELPDFDQLMQRQPVKPQPGDITTQMEAISKVYGLTLRKRATHGEQ